MAQYLPILSSLILAFSFIPLISKVRRNRSVSGLSLMMMSFGVAQSSYFIAYNVYFERFFMLLPFVVTGVLSSLILYYFVRYNATKEQLKHLSLMMILSVAPFSLLLLVNVKASVLLNWLTYIGLIMSSVRVIPQTIKTIKSADVSNLSARYFILQFIAGICGLAAELAMVAPSISHILTFVMILVTNAVQIGCIQIYRQKTPILVN